MFSNDRRRVRGVPLYSSLVEVSTETPEDAVARVSTDFGAPKFAPLVAVEWPPRTRASRAWFTKHVATGTRQ